MNHLPITPMLPSLHTSNQPDTRTDNPISTPNRLFPQDLYLTIYSPSLGPHGPNPHPSIRVSLHPKSEALPLRPPQGPYLTIYSPQVQDSQNPYQPLKFPQDPHLTIYSCFTPPYCPTVFHSTLTILLKQPHASRSNVVHIGYK